MRNLAEFRDTAPLNTVFFENSQLTSNVGYNQH